MCHRQIKYNISVLLLLLLTAVLSVIWMTAGKTGWRKSMSTRPATLCLAGLLVTTPIGQML